jgi:class 3 adenylate cyclase
MPETRYATTDDEVSIAYQIVGEGPIDLVVDLGVFGNVEILWTFEPVADLLSTLASFSRLILHDRRGVGMSGGGGIVSNLETQARDLLAVIDACRSARPALFGSTNGGAALAMFAATYPERVAALTWFGPMVKTRWTPDYPWGRSPEQEHEFTVRAKEQWGTPEFAHWYLTNVAPSRAGDHAHEVELARVDRHFCAPSTGLQFAKAWNDTDVTNVLGALRCPTLLIDREAGPFGPDEARYVQELIPGAALTLLPGEDFWVIYGDRAAAADVVREFLGVKRSFLVPDTVLSTVLFTDIVHSTSTQVALGDRRWKELVLRHHTLVRDTIDRYRGFENDTAGDGFYATFDGPARAIRCGMDVVERVRDLGIEVRVGVHTGECELIDGKPGGIAVTTGSRIAALAGPSEILISQTVKDLVAGSGLAFEEAGEHELKGVPDRWRLYRVVR